MVSVNDMKDLVLYKRPFFLPINPTDKKHGSEIMLLTPNFQSSINAMKAPYIINKRYFESYYLEKNITRYISDKGDLEEPTNENYIFEANLSTKERKQLPDSAFGIPSERRYPMPDKEHVKLAIKFFNHVEKEYESELAKNIIKKIKEFDMKDEVNVGEKNRFYPYWKNSDVYHESALIESSTDTDDLDYDYYFEDEVENKIKDVTDMVDDDDQAIHEGAVVRNHASAIFLDDHGKLLVFLRSDGVITLPGLFLGGGNDKEDALKFDMKGLFNLDINEMKALYTFTYSDTLPNGSDAIINDITYLITNYSGKLDLKSKNIKSAKFVTMGELTRSKNPLSRPLMRYMSQYGKSIMKDYNDYTERRLGIRNNVRYQGYDSDITIASKFINADTLRDEFDKCSVGYPNDDITVIISRSVDDFGYIDDRNITIMSKDVFENQFAYEYHEYISFISCVFAYHTINPVVSDFIVLPLSMYKCGIVDDELDNQKFMDKYEMERLFRYIDETYGDNEIKRIVRSNDTKAVMRYAREYAKDRTIQETAELIRELESILESADKDEPKTEVPSLDNIADLGKKIVRHIKRNTVYKMNKIRRDIERGNTGTETRTITSVEKVKNNDIVQSESVDWLWIDENEIIDENVVYFLEDTKYDTMLRNALYKDRIKNNKQVIAIYEKVKEQCPFIKYTFTNIERYDQRNIFFDLSYYNESYFRNISTINTDKANTIRDLNVYTILLKRLISDTRFKSYEKKTIFIPVLDWRHNDSMRMWVYREDLNPISIIYNMMKNSPRELVSLFDRMDVIFLGGKNYFKINFSDVDLTKTQNLMKFTNLIKRMVTLGYNSPADPDPDDEPENSASGIAMDIIDKVEKSQNIEIKNVSHAVNAKNKLKMQDDSIPSSGNQDKAVRKVDSDITINSIKTTETKSKETVKDYSGNRTKNKTVTVTIKTYTQDTTPEDKEKATKIANPSVNNAVNAPDKEQQKDNLVKAIAKAAEGSSTSDEAINKLDKEDEFKELLNILNAEAEENVRIDKARASRMAQLSEEFRNKEINGKSVKDLLSQNPNDKKLPETSLPIASINDDWKHMSFMNFDKLYDPDSDIVKMLDAMKNWSYPIAVRDIRVEDTSTSEDLINTWYISCEDFKGTRFTLTVDIPIFINDKFLMLRGNKKVIMIQSTLVPVIKTDLNTCQIISASYMKIFVRLINTGSRFCKSFPATMKISRALTRYEGSNVKITYGDNTKICGKYELPVDYIDLAGTFDRIETPSFIFYFNQDELRKEYVVDDTKGIPLGISKNIHLKDGKEKEDAILYYSFHEAKEFKMVSRYISLLLQSDLGPEYNEIYDGVSIAGMKFAYSEASVLAKRIPLVVVCAYLEGLTSVLTKAGITFSFKQKLDRFDKTNGMTNYIEFSDGYLIYDVTYSSSLLMNGFTKFDTSLYSLKEINSKKMYMDFLQQYGPFVALGLDNSYDCMIDPITKEILEIYKLPTDYVSVLLYSNSLLADNRFAKHTDVSVRRLRRKELVAGYFYKALTSAYHKYVSEVKNTRRSPKMFIKRSEVIDSILSKDPSSGDLSVNNVINDIECANTVTNKGLVGMNTERGYTLDKRGFDDSMLNILAMSTGFAATVGVNRQATLNCSIEGARGLVKPIDNDTNKLSAANSLCISEAITPFGSTHDDPFRTLMTYVQTSKHTVRCAHNDPLLVTNGADEAVAYLSSDIFAYKAKKNGVVKEVVNDPAKPTGPNNYMIIEYDDGTNEYINLAETIEKNSDGGYYVPLKLDTDLKVGQRVKAGSVVAYDKKSFSNDVGESKNLALNVGTLAKVAVLNTDEGFEDSAALTEEFSKKLGTEVIVAKEVKLDKNDNIFLQKKIGDHVGEGDTLLSYQASLDDDIADQLLKNLSIDKDRLSDLGRNPIKSKYTGTLEDIKVYRTVDMDELSPSLQKLVKMYEGPIKEKKKILEQYGLKTNTLPITAKQDNVGKTKNVYDGVLVIFYIKYTDTMAIGDKIVFYSANKGTVKYLIPEGQEPYTDFRPEEHVDAFVNIASIQGRLVESTNLYGSLCKLMVELDRSCKGIAGLPNDTTHI